MWKTFEQESPEKSGWVLLSTNKGLAYAHYDCEKNQLGHVHLLGDQYNSTDKIKHWAKIEDQPVGDFETGANGFQTLVK
jgi:hypothetical protein